MVKVVGGGPGHVKCLTAEASDIIKSSQDVVSFGRVGESLYELNGAIRKVSRVEELLETISKDTVIIASGDPCFYGVVDYLSRNGIEIDEVVTGISSLQYMMSKLKRRYQDVVSLSFHGRELDMALFQSGKEYFVLTDRKNSPDVISKEMYSWGYRGSIILGSNLSYDDESIEYKRIGDSFEGFELSVMVIEIEMD